MHRAPDADSRDAACKPVEVLNFLGIESGQTVIDMIAAAGYYTEVLSYAVGPTGRVYMQNSAASLTGERGERTAAAIESRLVNGRLANVERLTRDPDDLGSSDNSVGIIDWSFIDQTIQTLLQSFWPKCAESSSPVVFWES